MRIGLISDTHGHLRPEVFERLDGVERILHAGDIGRPEILADLASIAPVAAVWGNTDGWDLRDVVSGSVEVELDGLRFGVAHGHRVAQFERLADEFPDADAIVHGHSHVPRCDRVKDVWFLNPGSAGPGGDGWPPSVAIAEINGRDLRVVHLDLRTGRALSL